MNAIRALGGFFSSLGRQAAHALSLTPPYLANLLWLIDQTFRDLASRGYGGNAAVYACVNLLSSSVAEPPLVAYTRQSDGEPGKPLDYGHPLAQLIRRPNPYMTQYEYLEMLMTHLCIVGKSAWWKERNNLGEPKALWPLRPDRVGPVYGDASQGEPLLIGWSYLVPGTSRYEFLPAQDVIMYNYFDPMGESGGIVEGLGPLQVIAAEVAADNEATRFVGAMVANYGQPGVVIAVKNPIPNEDEANLIKAAYMRDFGSMRRGTPAVVDRDATITMTGFNLQELEFKELRKVSESRIAAGFRVPAVLVGLLVGLTAAIKATTDELRAFFAETTLASHWRRIADQYTNDVAADFGEDLICRFDLTKVRALAGWVATDLQRIHDAFVAGVLTKNEYRIALKYDERDDGDVYAYGIAQGRGMQTEVPAGEDDTSGDLTKDTKPPTDPFKPDPVAAQDKATTDNPALTGRSANGHDQLEAEYRAAFAEWVRQRKTTAAEDEAAGMALLTKALDKKFDPVAPGMNGHGEP